MICERVNPPQIDSLLNAALSKWTDILRIEFPGVGDFCRLFMILKILTSMVWMLIGNFSTSFYLIKFLVSLSINLCVGFSSTGATSRVMIWTRSISVLFSINCISNNFDVLFCISFNFFSNCLFSLWIFLIIYSCVFPSSLRFLSCSLSYLLIFRRHCFSSCFSRTFPSMSSFNLSTFLVLFNFLIFVTNILLWFINRYISSVLLMCYWLL